MNSTAHILSTNREGTTRGCDGEERGRGGEGRGCDGEGRGCDGEERGRGGEGRGRGGEGRGCDTLSLLHIGNQVLFGNSLSHVVEACHRAACVKLAMECPRKKICRCLDDAYRASGYDCGEDGFEFGDYRKLFLNVQSKIVRNDR